MDAGLLSMLGIDASQPVAEQAAALVRKLPLRRDPPPGPRDAATVIESRWFGGASESHRVLAQLFRGATGRGSAFSSSWPYLEAAGRVVAPGLPVVAGSAEVTGPDGEYQLEERVVWREAVGERRPALWLEGAESHDQPGFDLVWFGASERYLIHRGVLAVEDLFSALRLTVTRAAVERVLVRGLRVDADVLDGMTFAADEFTPELEVRRPRELVPSDGWQDPAAVMGGRADIATVQLRTGELVAETLAGTTVVFKVVEERPGWRVFTWEGEYPYKTLAMANRNDVLSWTATLTDGLHPLAPGVRTQLAFDLRSDLISLD
jgi:hypothetical protein